MLEGNELEKAINVMLARLRAVNTWYIKKIASQIKKIGELSPSSINRLVAMSEMYANINDINEQLRITTGANMRTLRKIYEKALAETYTDPRFRAYLAAEPDALRPEAEKRIEQYVQGVYRQTAGSMVNLSNTTAITPMYADAIDKAILAASTGVGSYTEAMRDTIRNIGQAGMQVVYESGYHRRLDTAVRQNIVDGVNQINKNASIMIGDELGYDAIEISAHARSAPDHEPVQGHVFLKEEYEKLQAGLTSRDIDGRVFAGFRRPICEWNCRHTPMSFSTKWSKRKWTDEQLRQFIDDNHKGCTINGKHKTLYEAIQMMRDIETAVRREKDTAVAAQAAGDDALRQQCQRNINALVWRYAEIAKASGNAEKRERMTVEGFRAVKVPPKFSLTKFLKDDTIKDKESAFRQQIRDGNVNTKIDTNNQPKHVRGKVWKNQVRQAVNDGKGTPRSILSGKINPEEFVKKYAGTGKIQFPRSGTVVHEFLRMNYEIGRTFDKKTGMYIPAFTIQIKYTEKGVHIFPTIDKED